MDLIDALRRLDVGDLRRALAEHGQPAAESDLALLAGAHKARPMRLEFSEEERAESRAWLAEHGLRPYQPKVWHWRAGRA